MGCVINVRVDLEWFAPIAVQVGFPQDGPPEHSSYCIFPIGYVACVKEVLLNGQHQAIWYSLIVSPERSSAVLQFSRMLSPVC